MACKNGTLDTFPPRQQEALAIFEKKYGTGMVKVSSMGPEHGPINQTTGSLGSATKLGPGRRVGGELARVEMD